MTAVSERDRIAGSDANFVESWRELGGRGRIFIEDAGVNVAGYRRRGFGEAMTWQAVPAGAARGCRFAVLQASEMGKGISERMGFRVVCEYKTCARPEG